MAVAAIAFNGTRLNDADSNTGWGNYNTGGGAPASEFPLAYQVTSGTTTGAVNQKVNATTGKEGVDYNGSAVDYTAAANRLLFLKVYVSDAFDLATVWGIEFSMGSADQSNFHQYNIAGTGANLSVYDTYPAQGGYLITSIDCTIDTWAEVADSGGTTDQTAIIWYGLGADFVNGTAKSENVAFDAIDYGTGLTITAGDGASTEGNFLDFVSADQDTKANRWGVVTGSGNAVKVNGVLTIGTASVTEFLDITSILSYPDGYHSRGLVGVAVGLSNASTIINEGALHIGEGTRNGADANDTRPDYTVTGTTATSADFTHTLRNFRDVTYTSACDVTDFDIECHLLTQASCNLDNGTIRTNALTSEACLQDPTFGTATDLHDVTFIQVGAGHAFEIDTAGDYTLTNIFGANVAAGYGADTTDSAGIDVTAGSGTVNLTISGGDTPTYKTAGATVNIIAGAVLVQAKAALKDGTAVENARIYLKASDGTGPFPFEDTVTITRATTTATVAHTAHGMATNDKIVLEGITDKTEDNWRVIQITVTTVNAYTFTTTDSGSTSYTGTIKSTFVALNGLTNASGILSISRVYPSNQPVTGWARKSTSSPLLQEGVLVGEVDSTDGFNGTAVMLTDE